MNQFIALFVLLTMTSIVQGGYEGVYYPRNDSKSKEQLILHEDGSFTVLSELYTVPGVDRWKNNKWEVNENRITLKTGTNLKDTHIFTFIIQIEEDEPILTYFATTSKKDDEEKFTLSPYWPSTKVWKKSANKSLDTTRAKRPELRTQQGQINPTTFTTSL